MSERPTDIEIRLATASDVPYIVSTWLNHYKEHSYFAKRIRRGVFFQWHHKIVERILVRTSTRVLIAHPKGEPEIIFGFIVTEMSPENPVVHFLFVKEELRRMGIGRALFDETKLPIQGLAFTHWTYTASELVKKFPSLIYNPYFI